ncbi:glycosyltransferase family 1 protein, partial [Salmonella enterica]|nr:glycosyltransferase family 4 protein [Salmonella enterica]EDF8673934.1 glycosyltransferase family 1 protein [Salmonella enterica]EIK3582752.1 glycosyltransferase family 1 protein [Salmonella enterica]
MKRLCYFVNSDWYFDLHWTERAVAARDAGYEIHIISHFIGEEIIKKFKTLGFICHNVSLVAQSFNIFVFFRAFLNARKIIKE